MRNSSGFYGYSVAAVYPNMGDMMGNTMATVPDPEEIEALSGIEPEKKVTPAVEPGKKTNLWLVFGAVAVLLLVFGMPSLPKG